MMPDPGRVAPDRKLPNTVRRSKLPFRILDEFEKDADVQWLRLDSPNRDMEYSQLFDFLVKQACIR